MNTLIICEKPSAATKIAEALADGKPKTIKKGKVSYFELSHKNKKIFVASAVGHLFALTEANKSSWSYPVFDIIWKASFEIKKSADYTKQYYNVIKSLVKEADELIVATDYDAEGSVIGYNIIRFIANKNDAKRMKFSTMTKDELLESYENASNHLDFPQIYSGETRHKLDYYYGISLSRALTLAIKQAGQFKIMSIGRVQGPTLSILSKRELEIKKFISTPYWEIELITDKLNAFHKKGKFLDKKEAESIIKKTKGKKAFISSITRTEKIQPPPNPFDLTSLQLEAYRHLNFTPKKTLEIAQNLYIAGYISYPRTSSQKLPESINYKKILSKLSKQFKFSKLVFLLPKILKPNEGKKSDPAHPAIYVTGEIGSLEKDEENLYDLIAHRFLATFGENAKRETMSVEINVNDEIFITSGTRTTEQGWHTLYGRFAKFEENLLPDLKEKQELKVKDIKLHDKETQPPKRYTQASIIKELEKKSLGTKGTRSQILDTLYDRHYISENTIEVTNLGLKTVQSLNEYVPEILDEKLTRHFEKELAQIEKQTKKPEQVLEEAKKILTKISKEFKKNELAIGKFLLEANRETQAKASLVGKCNLCNNDLVIKYSKKTKGYLIGCSNYPKCNNVFSLPYGLPKPTNDVCKECGSPIVKIIRKGKRPYDYCISKECPSKKKWFDENVSPK